MVIRVRSVLRELRFSFEHRNVYKHTEEKNVIFILIFHFCCPYIFRLHDSIFRYRHRPESFTDNSGVKFETSVSIFIRQTLQPQKVIPCAGTKTDILCVF